MADVPHYQTKKMACIDVIEAALTPEEFKGFLKGNIIKYAYREGDKDDAQLDREKAADYACRLAHGRWLSDYASGA